MLDVGDQLVMRVRHRHVRERHRGQHPRPASPRNVCNRPHRSKAGRDRFWNEILATGPSSAARKPGIAAAEFLVATSNPVSTGWEHGGRKTAISAPYDDDDTLATVVKCCGFEPKGWRPPKTNF
jgi:hypothetical protein